MGTVRLFFISLALAAIAANADAQGVLYGALGAGGSSGSLYTVNPSTGVVTPVGAGIGFGVTGLAFHPTTGVLYGVTTRAVRDLITINTTTGVGTLVGSFGFPVGDISFRSDGTLFGWVGQTGPGGGGLVTINLTTGAATAFPPAGFGVGSGLAFDVSSVLYLSANGSSGALRTVNPATGATTVVATLSGAPLPAGSINALAFDPVGGALFAVNNNGAPSFLIQINVATGAITTIGALPAGFDALAFGPAAVPAMPEGFFLVLALIVASGAVLALRQRARAATP